MAVLLILFSLNFLGYLTANIAFRYEIKHRKCEIVLPTTPEFGVMPYTTLDANDPSIEQPWSVNF